ncbi:beta-hexosaminidase [Sphingomonas sp. Leaf357]|uniref:beta-N-acetylhexosaminidase n=1 Tax=Sphingomonas sp. Leaf357 TaxID=1736350 RepID=UPI000700537B|nr:family 20 glycosylhydrolase [Sphingomonas sp. Leaf357]KQS04706.1 beta-hexosaminidase [Sphingomonas sp. Leaf357]
MIRFRTLALAVLLSSTAALAETPKLVPMPASIALAKGGLRIAEGAGITAADRGAGIAARLLVQRVKIDRGIALRTDAPGPIHIVRDASIAGDEAYVLTIDARGATITASGDAGLVHGAMTLAQLLSPDAAIGKPVMLPALVIHDAPRFKWRGVMVDPARHFVPVPTLYGIIDQLAAQKLNVLHLHLTDDQGWRVEIKRYPDLTRIGAWRTPPSSGQTPTAKVGGFYTQDELKALVAYARDRAITILPEIDMPGHAQAAVASYPEIGVLGDRPEVGHDWGVNPWLFSPDDHSMAFIRNVLDELMAIFPSEFIHVGGDEAVKDQWERSPAVQAKMKALGLKTEMEMQSWMIDQLGEYLAQHGRRLIGWDEILEGGLPASASVMSWRGEKGAVIAANAGHDVVLSPAPTLYLDSLQSDHADEPPGRLSGGKSIVTLADLYKYDPAPVGLAPDKARHVLGAQANGWSEYLVTPEQVQHALFPRLSALAELTWSPKDKRDFASFVTRMAPQMGRYARAGIAAADSAFAVDIRLQGTRGDALRTGKVAAALSTQTGFGTIRYTLDGKTPTARSRAYAAPLSVAPGVVIRAAAFAADRRPTALPRRFETSRAMLLRRSASDLAACPKGDLGLRVPLTADATGNAPVYNVNIFDTCTMYPAAPLDVAGGFTVDVARLARHYGLAHDTTKQRQYYKVTEHGELIVRSGGCDGPVAATFPLPDPATSPNRMSFKGALPKGTGDADLCMQFTASIAEPFYTVEAMQLSERD